MTPSREYLSHVEQNLPLLEGKFVQKTRDGCSSSTTSHEKKGESLHYSRTFFRRLFCVLKKSDSCKYSEPNQSKDGQQTESASRIVASRQKGFVASLRGRMTRIFRILRNRNVVGACHVVVRITSAHVL